MPGHCLAEVGQHKAQAYGHLIARPLIMGVLLWFSGHTKALVSGLTGVRDLESQDDVWVKNGV